ncbi:heavy metal translocating P-type ATPase metal-binding domain-containing protein [Undibacterium sp. CY7W]|uniref:Heavy metal translocating P-type ATPase metal-binding domain-containing protein n=1 Tax=Undibacterium rugosum TaxID=2762291 RepID=A0A923HZI5_9BURK|nr:heavy metal translocating P-type ATPase metal-binding domain-containing protein [Undibacterium rugosum]MBR7778248.1 heavy metal translocating P-type ATPase metal-binding domain-containing protein [Undibacterium rugosum]
MHGFLITMISALSYLISRLPLPSAEKKSVVCFHCGERSRPSQTLYIQFNHAQQAVCCHGCLAILQAVEKNQMTADYLRARDELNPS